MKKCGGRRPTWLLRGVARASVASGREKADEIRLIPFAVGVLRELRSRRGLYTKKCVGRRPMWLLRGVARASVASGREKADEIRLIPFAVGVPRELCFRRGLYTKKCVGRRPTWLLRGVARASAASGKGKGGCNRADPSPCIVQVWRMPDLHPFPAPKRIKIADSPIEVSNH